MKWVVWSKKAFAIAAVMTLLYFAGFYKRIGLFRVTDYLFTIGIGFVLVGCMEYVADSKFLAPVGYGLRKFADIFMNRVGSSEETAPGKFTEYLLRRNKDKKSGQVLHVGAIFLFLAVLAAMC